MNLNEILDVEFPIPQAQNANIVVVPTPDVSASTNNSIQADALEARRNVRQLIAQGTTAITELLEIAREVRTPRSYEVISNMLKSLSELSHDLMIVHQQEALLVEPPTTSKETGVHIEQAVFIGSTADLQDIIKLKRELKYANNVVEAEVSSKTDI